MGSLQTLAAILGLSTVSGINLYLTVLLVGGGQRLGWIHGLPPDLAILAHPAVLAVAGLLFLLEFAADKLPFVTPVWDGIHTFIRPVGGALLALGAAADLSPLAKVLALLAGGTIALGAHGSKMGVRLLAHTAPEPASHSLLSVAEDLGVIGLLALAYRHPQIALPVLGAILLGIALLLPLLLRALLFVLAGFRGVLRSLAGWDAPGGIPEWVDLKALELTTAGARHALPCFARKVVGLPRLHRAYLVQAEDGWHLLHHRWFRAHSFAFAGDPVRITPGLLWDRVIFMRRGRAQILLTGRDWRRALPAAPRA